MAMIAAVRRELTSEERNDLAVEMLGPNGDDGPAQRLARSLVKGRPDLIEIALDAATDAVLWALAKFEMGEHRSFRGLALQTVRIRVASRVKNHFRQQADRGEHGNLRDFADEIPAPPHGGCSILIGADEILNPRELLAVELCFVGGCTQRECAKIMGISKSTVHDLLSTAARKMR